MTLEALKTAKRVIGIKQVAKAVKREAATEVFIADDADAKVVEPLETLCTEQNVPVSRVSSMKELGTACNIEVGAAAAAAIK
ncbi:MULTISPECIES: ribosomal L7Ae/L30e/S12e/Gadd45 family protein [Selenomonas]|jgi:large subunit ribosomal protein L7A|uniref:50S ribosomal protein L7ae-like protein n=1 Tax=Selenomonas ruminantium TaxID=971 RepID=A0A1K1QGC5_SELRU|nr:MULTISPECIES: ribosomal L7Ae/L30e/S12e/Gadd45 family protein [Selenomonas]MBE6085973.1 50S ribosomal protein L7ae-like protein [Selenomonas ruminantium]SEA18560.1 large subunit ribosomal protein L7A [Selenomonas ruminantium]SFW59008.1 large subunit ribosomal protein L7A [Selenomonas ruminantium]